MLNLKEMQLEERFKEVERKEKQLEERCKIPKLKEEKSASPLHNPKTSSISIKLKKQPHDQEPKHPTNLLRMSSRNIRPYHPCSMSSCFHLCYLCFLILVPVTSCSPVLCYTVLIIYNCSFTFLHWLYEILTCNGIDFIFFP